MSNDVQILSEEGVEVIPPKPDVSVDGGGLPAPLPSIIVALVDNSTLPVAAAQWASEEW